MKTGNLFSQKAVETAPHMHVRGFTGEQLMVMHITFEKGAVGAIHSHPHEQMSFVLRGEIEFTLGEERKILKAGDTVAIPGHILHGVVALTEVEMLDIFTPIRDDLAEKLGV